MFSNLSFRVDEVPRRDSRTADLFVTDGNATYLIEAKDKVEAESQSQERRAILNAGDLYKQGDSLAHDNRISGILRKAQKQLDDTPKDNGTFQLIWFHACGIDADLKYRQAFATFYGSVDLIALDPRNQEITTCFYFDYNASFTMPTVEALILTDNETLQLCLNEFSHRADEFRSTQLCRKFIELDGVVDPAAMIANGQIIACRTAIPRKNDDETAKALQKQTGVLYSPIRLVRHAYSAATQTCL